ncbi:methyltransferase family protein [Neorhizobium galegae]|uniref:methyltransferase family protein n=1 Tax=Neorhizobium galegae TaxID=399 RepID=UPI00062102E0|nr:protein-S-isoprenylcysteine O-methyltransferase [Neorhizobium galegae]KAB1122717.1 hypothetical protein F4V90_18585 [Neorhizobium galegae]MCQ1807846.1 protein-S-isoprenylcysteine O-methyltransferase [Neorhizobium galegae]CDZ56639.1 Isoprenylcysteine carboxyl methyltransferase [Neorhizobium galegae bv. orientalis]CDZ64288.1 Isoprenylcysteine carboxyl methyltransferase [Neorhizobium galegae bv. orientalis]
MAIAVSVTLAVFVGIDGLPFVFRAWPVRTDGLQPRAMAMPRIGTKLVGLCALLGLTIAVCVIFPFFWRSVLVQWILAANTFKLLPLLILGCAVAITYIALTDRLMDEPDDYLLQVGKAVLLQDFRKPDVLFALRVLAIKCFFLVLMFSGGVANFEWLFNHGLLQAPAFSIEWLEGALRLIYLVDVILAASGYVATWKLFGWHVRATEETARGWLVCLLCYDPFFSALSGNFFPPGGAHSWSAVFPEGSAVFIAWSGVTLSFHILYLWATVAFGPRFSNLTHRGIITAGPYRFMKHPAYLAKNIAWWLFALPGLVASGPMAGLAGGIPLALVSMVYVLRAHAEERMLAVDPVYRAYAQKIATHGLAARLRRRLTR